MIASPSTRSLFRSYARAPTREGRDELIRRHERLVLALAHKFARPGVLKEDLVQTGWLALIRAIDRYDPGWGTDFSTYALPCIVGEIKRYFRDQTWALRVPRRVGELALTLRRTEDDLAMRLGRAATVPEIAQTLGVSTEAIAEAMEAYEAYQTHGLDQPRTGENELGIGTLAETLGECDPAMEAVPERVSLDAAIAGLDCRAGLIIRRRFFDLRTQADVAVELNVSQMQVSRLERAAIERLRGTLTPAGY